MTPVVPRSPETREAILSLPTYPVSVYEKVDLNRLTVYTIYLLRERSLSASIENIAVANHRQFPKRFSMVGFPEYPDISRVNRALLQLRPKYRNWATGNTRLGWQLTVAGEAEARVIRDHLAEPANTRGAGLAPEFRDVIDAAATRTVDVARELRRVRDSNLFAKAQAGWEGVSTLEVFDVLGAYTHTPAPVLKKRLRELRQQSVDANERELVTFLDEISERFSLLFVRR